MRRFLQNMGIFLLIAATVGIGLEWLVRGVPNDYKAKAAWLDAHAGDVQVLVLGGSQSLFGIDPALLHRSAFNACHISQSLNFDHEILKKYKARLTHLQTIIVTMSFPSLGGRIEHTIENWRIRNYNLYYGIHAYSRPIDYTELLSHRFQDNISLITGYYLEHVSNLHCTDRGWGTNYNSIRLDTGALLASGRSDALKHNVVARGYIRENLAIVDSILAIAAEKHCRVVFYTPPAHRGYRQHVDMTVFRDMTDKLEGLARLHSNCLYYNLFDDASFGDGDYFDGTHLNHAGAKRLSLKMDSLLNFSQLF